MINTNFMAITIETKIETAKDIRISNPPTCLITERTRTIIRENNINLKLLH